MKKTKPKLLKIPCKTDPEVLDFLKNMLKKIEKEEEIIRSIAMVVVYYDGGTDSCVTGSEDHTRLSGALCSLLYEIQKEAHED